MLKELENQLIELNAEKNEAQQKRDAIMKSPEYLELQKVVTEATQKQVAMLDTVPDTNPAYNNVKSQIMEEFKDKELEEYGSLVAKFKEKKEINTIKLARILDYDEYLTISSVTQKNLNELCKDEKYKPIKKAIKGCVEVVSKEMVDVVFG